MTIVCGRFEGVDERVIAGRNLEEVSIGDYVLSGGEMAALTLLDACVRLLPGVMGKIESGMEESFEGGLLEYPHYTRPREWEGRTIPDVLTGGNHGAIARWRGEEARRITTERRPDLLQFEGLTRVRRVRDRAQVHPHPEAAGRIRAAGLEAAPKAPPAGAGQEHDDQREQDRTGRENRDVFERHGRT